MTFKQLVVFSTIANHLNITKAARELHISQPAISRQLKILERNYQAALFMRSAGGIRLTEKGRVFLKYVNLIQTELGRLDEKFPSPRRAMKAQTLAVGGTYGPSAYLLPLTWTKFRRRHPGVDVRLLTGSMRSIRNKVIRGNVEIAVVSSVEPPPNVRAEPYGTLESVAFVAADHPIAKKRVLSASDLGTTPLIIRGGLRGLKSTSEIIFEQLKDRGFKTNIALRCESSEAVKAAVRRHLGVGILYRDTVSISLRRGEFKLIKLPGINMRGNLFIIYSQDRPLSANAQDFLALLRQRAFSRRHQTN